MREEQLIFRSRRGDHRAFALLVDKYTSYLFTIVFRIVNNEEESKDLVQDTFIIAWQKLKSFDAGKAKFSTWLYTIATRLAIDVLRKRRMQVELTDAVLPVQAEGVHRQLSNSEVGDLINQATQHLSEMQKVVFVLRDIEGMEVDEVSEITGWSAKQIKDNLFVARKKIRAQLKQMME